MSEPRTKAGRELWGHMQNWFDDASPELILAIEAEVPTPAEPGLLKGLNDAHAALASAVMWLDGEYVGKPRVEFNREAWSRTARKGLAALVAARHAQPAAATVSEDGRSRLRDRAPGVDPVADFLDRAVER